MGGISWLKQSQLAAFEINTPHTFDCVNPHIQLLGYSAKQLARIHLMHCLDILWVILVLFHNPFFYVQLLGRRSKMGR